MVSKSLRFLKLHPELTLFVGGRVSNETVSNSNTLQFCVANAQHTIYNSKQVTDLDSFNSGDIYLSIIDFIIF